MFSTWKLKAFIKYILLPICFLSYQISQAQSETLTLSVHPYKSASELVSSFSPLADLLSQAIKQDIEVRISRNYEEHIETIGADKVDIAYLGPASYVEMVEKYGKKTLLARQEINGKPVFQGKIFTYQNSKLASLTDLKGKKFAFGSKDSTMSYSVPRFVLEQAGITENQLGTYDFLGNHENVALAVLMGKYDAGAVKEEVFYKYQEKGLVLLADTPEISEHLFVVRNNLDDELTNKIRDAMLNIHTTAQGVVALKSIKKTMTRLVPVNDSDYDMLRKILSSQK